MFWWDESHPWRFLTEKLLPQWGEGEGTICSSGKEIQPLSPPVNLSIDVIDVLPLKWYRGSAFNNHLCLWGCPFQIMCTLSIGQMWTSNNGRNLHNELCMNGIHLTSQLVSPLVWWPQCPCQCCRTLCFIHYANSPYAVSCCLCLSAPFSSIPVDLQARRIIVPFFLLKPLPEPAVRQPLWDANEVGHFIRHVSCQLYTSSSSCNAYRNLQLNNSLDHLISGHLPWKALKCFYCWSCWQTQLHSEPLLSMNKYTLNAAI